MEKRKPNTLLTVTLVLLLLAVLVCLIVFISSRGSKKSTPAASVSADTGHMETPTLAPTQPDDVTEAPETTPPPSYDAAALQSSLDERLEGLGAEWQVVLIDLADGKQFESCVNCNQDTTMVAADLTKLFLMAATYDRASAGKIKEEQVTGLINRMIRDDSADAANELTKLLGGGEGSEGRKIVNDYALSIGCAHTEFNRLFGESGTQNYTTARDCATLLKMIAEGSCVSADASAKMQEILTGTEGERIPAGVPAGTKVVHLNANITDVSSADAGIVYSDSHNFVLAIICNDPITPGGTNERCVQLTQIAWEAMSK